MKNTSYIQHMNEFAAASLEAGLGPNEGWLYMKLFWEANRHFWEKEYIELSTSELQKLTGIKSHNTLKKARRILKDKGFISYLEVPGKKTLYRVEGCQNLTPTMSKNDIHPVKNRHPVCQNLTPTMSKNDTLTPLEPSNTSASETSQDYKTNKTYKTIYNNSKNDTEINDDFREIIDCYCENISPDVSSYYSERLAQDMEAYGKDKLIAAMTKAAEMGKRSLAYAEGILKNKKGGEGSGKVKRHKAKEPDEADNFFDYLDEAIANQHYPWEDEEYTSV